MNMSVALLSLAFLPSSGAELHAVSSGPDLPTASSCANCSEGLWFGRTVHYWHGEDGCFETEQQFAALDGRFPLVTPGCYDCESPHCEDPSVPHEGPCPDQECSGGGSEVLAALDAGNLNWLIERADERPEMLAFDHARQALQAFDCRGNLVLHVAVERTAATVLGQGLSSALR